MSFDSDVWDTYTQRYALGEKMGTEQKPQVTARAEAAYKLALDARSAADKAEVEYKTDRAALDESYKAALDARSAADKAEVEYKTDRAALDESYKAALDILDEEYRNSVATADAEPTFKSNRAALDAAHKETFDALGEEYKESVAAADKAEVEYKTDRAALDESYKAALDARSAADKAEVEYKVALANYADELAAGGNPVITGLVATDVHDWGVRDVAANNHEANRGKKEQADMRKPSTAQISAVMRAMGSKGGSVCGPQKARTSEQARAASRARWDKARAARHEAAGQTETGQDLHPPESLRPHERTSAMHRFFNALRAFLRD